MKYIETDYDCERVTFEHEGEEHIRDLRSVQHTDYTMQGNFEFEGKEYLLHKYMYLDPANGTCLKIEIMPV